ncbi:glucose-1-phosphate cytidylyltransferase [Bacteriovoracaceae bacterium]|nr:glucose-1-phosphate cytidylyltransferase [Bacteriovoracaceae bacterium]
MKTVILCGGFGTRIRDVADNIPKPMIPIGGLPIMWHIMKYYSHWGHKDFILCLGYKAEVIKDFFLNYESRTRDLTINLGMKDTERVTYLTKCEESDWQVTLSNTGLNTMTGGRVRRIKNYLKNEKTFMLTYGDGVSDIDIDDLIKFHHSHGKAVTVSGVRPPGRFGELEKTKEGLVTGFNEKPQTSGGRINGGFFVCNQEIFNFLDGDDKLVLEQEPMNRLVEAKELMVYEHDGFWQPMDTYREYSLLNSLYNSEKAPWVKW